MWSKVIKQLSCEIEIKIFFYFYFFSQYNLSASIYQTLILCRPLSYEFYMLSYWISDIFYCDPVSSDSVVSRHAATLRSWKLLQTILLFQKATSLQNSDLNFCEQHMLVLVVWVLIFGLQVHRCDDFQVKNNCVYFCFHITAPLSLFIWRHNPS